MTLLSASLAEALTLKTKPTPVRLRTIHGPGHSSEVRRTQFIIKSADGSTTFTAGQAFVVESLHIPSRTIDWPSIKQKWDHLKGLPIQKFDSEDVGLLIGVDIAGALKQIETREPTNTDGPLAVRFPLGWTVMGNFNAETHQPEKAVHQVSEETDQQIHHTWLKDQFASAAERSQFHTDQEKRAMSILQSTIRLVQGHFEVGLLWKSDDRQLPDNRTEALRNLYANQARCRRDPAYQRDLCNAIEKLVEQGYSRKLSVSELKGPVGGTWYLPYFMNYKKPDKPRLVFDGSRKFRGTSLNGELLSCPNLLNSLFCILMHLRENEHPVSMDIKGMFHQVRVPEKDQPAQRYVYRHPDSSGPPETYQLLVHFFGAASSMTTCVYALQQLTRDHPEFADVSHKIFESFYVDNFLDSFTSEEEAVHVCRRLIDLLALAGFDLSQMVTSSRRILSAFPASKRQSQSLDITFDPLPENRMLGQR